MAGRRDYCEVNDLLKNYTPPTILGNGSVEREKDERERERYNLRLLWGGSREPYVLPSNKGEIKMDGCKFISG